MKNEPPFSTFRKKMNKCCAQPKNMTYFFGPCNDFFPSCDFLSKGEQIVRVIRQKAKRGFIIFSYLSATYYTHMQEKSFNVIYIFLRIADQKERLIENLKNGPKNVSLTYTSRFSKNRPLLLTLLLLVRMVSGQ